jgi:hypothetical protein
VNPELYLDKDGYPKVKHQGKIQSVSRLVMKLLYGKIAVEGKLVCHTCHNRACINPAHLYLGTPQSNSDDKYRDGTMPLRETHGRWRSEIKTEDIVYMYEVLGLTQTRISKETGLSQSAISHRLSTKRGNR